MGPGRQKTNLSLICAAAAAGVGLEPQCAVRRAEWSWIIVTFRFFFLCLVRRPEICGWSRRCVAPPPLCSMELNRVPG